MALRQSRLVLPRWASWVLLAGAMVLFIGDAALQAHRQNLASTTGVMCSR